MNTLYGDRQTTLNCLYTPYSCYAVTSLPLCKNGRLDRRRSLLTKIKPFKNITKEVKNKLLV